MATALLGHESSVYFLLSISSTFNSLLKIFYKKTVGKPKFFEFVDSLNNPVNPGLFIYK
jgi:hypothetical protein